MKNIYVHVNDIADIREREAVKFAQETLGQDWHSSLVTYRLESEFQRDWLAEVGRWLHFASQNGFLDEVLKPIGINFRRLNGSSQQPPNPNDLAHLNLQSRLAEAQTAYVLCKTGWQFGEYEPTTCAQNTDADLRLKNAYGESFFLQVKAPDQPGKVVNHKIVEGEYDDRIITALDKARANETNRSPARYRALSTTQFKPSVP
ncbi:MAG: hypothetical protein IPJ88_04685 [Myxococcales bacterium]|nr:MAG: hypothetical protein IPJ88_04685 [Myxococcales bacterium]